MLSWLIRFIEGVEARMRVTDEAVVDALAQELLLVERESLVKVRVAAQELLVVIDRELIRRLGRECALEPRDLHDDECGCEACAGGFPHERP